MTLFGMPVAVWDGEEHAIFADGKVKKLTTVQLRALKRGDAVVLSPAGATYPLTVGDPRLAAR